jgi:copper transport protein
MRTAFALLATLCALVNPVLLSAHGGLRRSDPEAGATLGATPKTVRLFFSEPPELSLAEIQVFDASGVAQQTARPQRVLEEPRSLVVPVRPLEKGVYVVNWRVVSAIDGHATSGSFAFGVKMPPSGAAITAQTANPPAPALELIARWLLIAGFVVVLGAAVATVAGFGGAADLLLAWCGWGIAATGLALFGMAQSRGAGTGLSDLLRTGLGQALLGRGTALALAGAALTVAAARPARRRGAMEVTAFAALAGVAVHASSGHAGAARGAALAASVAAQWAHFAAAGVWLGGLAALLLGLRGAPSDEKATRVRRFARLAALALLAIVATGIFRGYRELSALNDLRYTEYGRALAIKVGVTAAIALLGAVNRWFSVPRAAASLRSLRRAGGGELALATAAIAAAAALGMLPPPASGFGGGMRQLTLSGADFATTVRVELTVGSDRPGPNEFTLRAVDYDSREPVEARRVALRFAPIDDPGIDPTWLPLERSPANAYVGTGANLSFDGRWRVTALVERASDAVEVPLDLQIAGPVLPVSATRIPGAAPHYTVEVPRVGYVRVEPQSERPGATTLTITFFHVVLEPRPIQDIVVTLAAREGPVRPLHVRRIDAHRFTAEATFVPGRNTIVVVARGEEGNRTRTSVSLDIPPS